jgi:hypothetical protein
MRPPREAADGHSSTPIYDALYAEFRRSFRALPGDRSGEENLGFTSFGTGLHAARGGHGRHGGLGQPTWQRDSRQQTGRPAPAALPPGPRRST